MSPTVPCSLYSAHHVTQKFSMTSLVFRRFTYLEANVSALLLRRATTLPSPSLASILLYRNLKLSHRRPPPHALNHQHQSRKQD
jgi:hypothetical protein